MQRLIWFLALMVWVSGCATMPAASKSKMYQVTGAGFILTVGKPEESEYALNLTVNNPQKKPLFIEAEFQNPCHSNQPLYSFEVLSSNQKEISLKSPKIGCLKAGRYYKVTVRTYDSANKKVLQDRLAQAVYCSLDNANVN